MFNEYLIEKNIKPEPELTNAELPAILSDFYIELHKKKVKKNCTQARKGWQSDPRT